MRRISTLFFPRGQIKNKERERETKRKIFHPHPDEVDGGGQDSIKATMKADYVKERENMFQLLENTLVDNGVRNFCKQSYE